MILYILWKPHMWEKPGSHIVAKNSLGQLDLSIL